MGAHSVSVEALVNLLVGSDAVGPYLKELSGGVSIPINLGGGAGKGNTLGKQLKGFNEYVQSSAASIDGISKRVKEIVGNKGFQQFAKQNERAAQSYRKLNEEFGKAAESISPKESMQFTTELANRRGQIIQEAFSEIGITAEQISEAYIKSASSPAEAVKMAAKIFNAGENGFISGESGPLMQTLNVAANKLFDKLNGSGSERYYKDGEFTATGVKEVENFRRVLQSASQALNGNFEAANRSLRQYNENAETLNKVTADEAVQKQKSTRQQIKDAESLDKAVQGVTKAEKTVESAAKGIERVSETAKVEAAATTEAAKATSQATETIIANNEAGKQQAEATTESAKVTSEAAQTMIMNNETTAATTSTTSTIAAKPAENTTLITTPTEEGVSKQKPTKSFGKPRSIQQMPEEIEASKQNYIDRQIANAIRHGVEPDIEKILQEADASYPNESQRSEATKSFGKPREIEPTSEAENRTSQAAQREAPKAETNTVIMSPAERAKAEAEYMELMDARNNYVMQAEWDWEDRGITPTKELYDKWWEEAVAEYPDTELSKRYEELTREGEIGEEIIEQNNTMIAQEEAKGREIKKTNEAVQQTERNKIEAPDNIDNMGDFFGGFEEGEPIARNPAAGNGEWIYDNSFFKTSTSQNPLQSFAAEAEALYGGRTRSDIAKYVEGRVAEINGELAKLPERAPAAYTGTAENQRYQKAIDAEKYFSERIQQVDTAIDNSVENYSKQQGVTEDAVTAMIHTNEQVFKSVMGMKREATNEIKQGLRQERIQAGKQKMFREGLDTNIKEFLTPSMAKEIASGKLDMVQLRGITPEAAGEWGNMAQVFRTAATGYVGKEQATPEQVAQAKKIRDQVTQQAMQQAFKPTTLSGMVESAITQSGQMLESARNLSKYRAELDATESKMGETTSAYEQATIERAKRIQQLEKGLMTAKGKASEAAQTQVITRTTDAEGKEIVTTEKTNKQAVMEQAAKTIESRINALKTEQAMADEMYKNTLAGLENQGKKQAKQWSDAQAATVALGVNPNSIKGSVAAQGFGLKTFGQKMTGISNQAMMEMMGAQMVFEQFKGIVSGMYSYVEAFDSQMREYKKIQPNWNEKDMRSYVRGLSDMGQTYGKTVEEMAEASIVMTRGGYGGADAASKQINRGMTEAALLMSNIADEELSVSDASDQLISVTKAYGVKDTDAAAFSTSITDKVNEVSNNFSITSNALMEALPIVSSSAAVSGINENELIGLITGGAEISQDPNKTATSLKTMLGRFNQINDESASTGKWLEGWLNEKIGASGYRDENGQLDFYKMVQEVGGIWDTLTQDEKSLFSQKLAGSRQASNFANLMQNLEGIQSATDTALNSTGSAARSNKAKMDSIEGRKAQLEASISDFMTDTISSGAIKNLLSAANAMVQFFNAIPGSSQIAGIGAVTLMLGALGTLVPAMAKFYAGGALGGMATSIGGLMMGTASIGNGALATGVANASAGLALMGGRAKDFLTGIRNAGAIKAGTTTAQGLATTSAGAVGAGAAIAPALPYLAAIATTIGILKIAANNRDKQNQAIVTNFENLVTAYDAYKKQSDNSLSTIKDIQGRQLEAQLNTEGYTKDTKENQEKYNAEYKKRMENANDSYENMEQFKTNLQGEDLREYNNALANYKFAQMEMENTRQSMQQQFASYAIAKNAKTGILGMASDALGLGFIQDLNEYSNNQDRVRESTKGMFQLQGELTYAQQHGGKTTDIEASLERYTEATARNQQAAQDSLVEIQEGYFDLMESGKKTFKTDNPMDVITEIAESGNKELSDALLRASLAMGVFDEATYNAAASLAGLEVESEFLETTYANIGQDLGAQTKGLNNVLELESKSWSKLSGEDIATITSAYNLDDEQWGNFWDAWQEGGQAKTDAVERALMQSLENTYGSEGLANMDLEMLAKYFEPLFGNQSMEIAKAIQDDAKIEEENKEQTRQEVLESGNYSMYAGAKMLGELTQGNLIGAVDQLEYNNQGTRSEVMGPDGEGAGEWQDTAENWLADLAGYGLSTSEQIAMTEEWLNRGNTLIDSEGNQLDLGQVIGMIETTTTPIDANTAAVEANTAAILSSLNQNELDALGISKNEDGTYTLPNGQIVGTPTPELTWSEENQNVIGSTTADNTTAEFAPTSDSSSMDKSPELGESAFSESGFDFFKKIFGDLFVPETTTETTVDEAPEVTHETREVETEVITPEIEDQTATVNYEANMETPEAENLTGEIDYETNVETPEVPEVPDQTIGVTADTSSADAALSGVKAEEDAIDSNKDVTITAHDNATGVLGTIVGLLNSVTDRSATVTTTYVEEHYGGPKAKGGKVTFQDRKKKFNGERHADGGTTGRSGLVGTWLGDEYTGSGQTKPELVVTPDGNAHLAGLNGWEFENLPAGTQVYSNSDTKKLLGERHANGGYIGELLKAGSASNREDIVVGYDRTPKKSSDSDKNKGKNSGGNKNSSSQSNKTAAVAKTIEGYIEDIGDKLEDICKQFDTMLSVVEDSIDLLEYEEEKTDTPSEKHFKLLENKLDILNRYQAELEAQGATVENSSDYRDVLKQIAELMQDEINLRQKQYEHNRDVFEAERNQMEFQGRNDPDKYVNQTIASYEKSRQSALEQAEYLMSQGYDKNSDEVIDLLEEANGYTEDIEDTISDSTQRLVESINKNFKKTESAYDYMIWQAEEEKEQLDKEQARSDALYDLESERLAKEDVRIDRLQRIQDAAKELSDVMDERVRVMTSEGFTWDVDPQAYEQAQKNYTDTMADIAREVRDENREEAHKQERIDRYEQYYGEGSYGEEALATADSTYAEVQKVKDEQEKQTHLQDKILYEQKYGNMLASEALKLASSDEELSKYTSEFIQNEVAGILDDQFGSIKGVKEALVHGDISEAMDAILKERGGYNNLSKEEKYWFDMINGYRNQKIDILGNGATKYNTAEDFQLTRDQDVDKAVRRGIIEKGLSEIKESGKEVTYKDVMNLMNQAATYKNSAYDIGTGKIDLNSKTTQTIMDNQSYDVFKDTQQIAPRNSLAEKLNSEVNQFTIHSLNVTANNADDLVVSLQNYARTTLSINTIRK